MSTLQESLLNAVDTLAQSSVKSARITETIECIILSVEDAGLNLYNVEYKGNTFEAFAPVSSIYNIGDIVYVLVPEGDFSKTKVIIGAISPTTQNIIDETLTSDNIEISENLLDSIDGEYQLCTQNNNSSQTIAVNDLIKNINLYIDDDFRNYSLTAKIKTSILIEQQSNGNYGLRLYIPILRDPGTGDSESDNRTAQEDYKIINLDALNTIQGNPYRLTEQSYQKVNFTIPEGTKLDTKITETRFPHLDIFVEGFVQNPDITDNDIFIKNISLKAVDILTDEQKEGYYLTLVSDTGNFFLQNSPEVKVITPVLKVKGKTTKVATQDCYQFVKDDLVKIGSEGYLQLGGQGQRCLNDFADIYINEDGTTKIQYITNVYKCEVNKKDVISKSRYKCVLVKDTVQTSTEIIITNMSNEEARQRECKLYSSTGSNNFIKNVGNIELTAELIYPNLIDEQGKRDKDIYLGWTRTNSDGRVLDSSIIKIKEESYSKDGYIAKACYPSSAVEDINIISCTFYYRKITSDNLLEEKMIGDASISISTSIDPDYRVIIQNADVLYKYDSDGNSPMVADYAYPTSMIKEIKPLDYKVFKPDGTELTDEEYLYCNVTQKIPKQSMIKLPTGTTLEDDYYIIKSKGHKTGLNYNIDPIYNAKKNDNYVILDIQFKDLSLQDTQNIKFLKEGESGTNGSKYTAIIKYNGYEYGEHEGDIIHRLQLGYYKNAWYYADIEQGLMQAAPEKFDFSVSLYCDGVLVTEEYDDVEQEIFDSEEVTIRNIDNNKVYESPTNPVLMVDNKEIKIKTGVTLDNNSATSTIVRAKVSVGNKGELFSNKNQEIIYVNYPVDVVYISDNFEGYRLPCITGGFNSVLYASDGTNPQYDNTESFKFKNDFTYIDPYGDTYSDIYNYEQIVSNDNLKIRNSEKPYECNISPNTKFKENGISKNFVKLGFSITLSENEEEILTNRFNELKGTPTEPGLINECDVVIEKNNIAKSKIESFLNAVNSLINNANSKLESKTLINILSDRVKMLDALDKIREAGLKAEDYIVSTDVLIRDPANTNFYYEVLNLINSSRKILWQLPSDNNIKNIINDMQSLNTFNTDIKQAFKLSSDLNILSSGIKKSLKQYLTSVNSAIKSYNKLLTDNKSSVYFKKYAKNDNNSAIELNKLYNIFMDGKKTLFGNEYSVLIICCGEIFKNLSNQYDAIIYRLTSPFDLTNLNAIQIQNKLDELYSKEKPIYQDKQSIKTNIINKINSLFLSDNKNKEYYEDIIDKNVLSISSLKDDYIKEADECYQVLTNYDKNNQIYIQKPIIMLYNTYELSNITGQDGNKLYIDDQHGDNPQYLLAPQLGAGIKDKNKFTGVVMGVRSFTKETNNEHHVGIFAWGDGVQTYFLNAKDGSAIMGKSGDGQIIIDPKAGGLIYSSNYFQNYGLDGKPSNYTQINNTGMLIDLKAAKIHFGDENGPEGTTPGKIYSGGHDTIKSKDDGFFLSKDGLSIGSKVKITSEGIAYFGTNAVTDNKKCQKINGGTPESSNPSYISFNTDDIGFTSEDDGKEMEITTGGNNQIYISTKGIRIGSKFAVDDYGNVLANQINAKGGTIGDQTINNKGKIIGQTSSDNENIVLDARGSIKAGKPNEDGTISNPTQSIERDGNATFNNIHCNQIFTIGQEGTSNYQSSEDNGSGGQTNTFAFGNGTIALGNSTFGQGNNGISYNSNGVMSIGGTIYANAGNIGGCEITQKDGKPHLEVDSAHISSAVIDELKADTITAITSEQLINFSGQIEAQTYIYPHGGNRAQYSNGTAIVKDINGNSVTVLTGNDMPRA